MSASWSQAADRNKDAILTVLRELLPKKPLRVLEIGSGTGQHAVHFAHLMPNLDWQTSDLLGNHEDIIARIRHSRLGNVRLPRDLDAKKFLLDRSYDVVYTANTAHIMSISDVEATFTGVSQVLEAHGLFILYGPVNRNGEFTSESNARFDHQLRASAAHMGIRDESELDAFASNGGLTRISEHEMPANNRILVWQRS